MQAYAEGFDIFKNATSKELPEDIRYDLNLPDIAEVWRRGSVVSSWLLDLTAMALDRKSDALRIQRLRAGFGRRPLDDPGSARRSGSGRSVDRRAVHALPLAPGTHFRREDALRHAPEIRRTHRTQAAGKKISAASPEHTKVDQRLNCFWL